MIVGDFVRLFVVDALFVFCVLLLCFESQQVPFFSYVLLYILAGTVFCFVLFCNRTNTRTLPVIVQDVIPFNHLPFDHPKKVLLLLLLLLFFILNILEKIRRKLLVYVLFCYFSLSLFSFPFCLWVMSNLMSCFSSSLSLFWKEEEKEIRTSKKNGMFLSGDA